MFLLLSRALFLAAVCRACIHVAPRQCEWEHERDCSARGITRVAVLPARAARNPPSSAVYLSGQLIVLFVLCGGH